MFTGRIILVLLDSAGEKGIALGRFPRRPLYAGSKKHIG
jgi:hypothetical protein